MRTMLLMMSFVLLAGGQARSDRGEPLTPCKLALDAEAYKGKTVRVQSAITIGPHDEYLVVTHCTPEMQGTDYIFLSYDESQPSVKRLVGLLRKQAHRTPRTQVVATFSGILEVAQTDKFGAISARQKFTIRHVEQTSIEKR